MNEWKKVSEELPPLRPYGQAGLNMITVLQAGCLFSRMTVLIFFGAAVMKQYLITILVSG